MVKNRENNGKEEMCFVIPSLGPLYQTMANFFQRCRRSNADTDHYINSSPPSAAYMRQWIGSALVQIMACRPFGAKPLSKQMLDYYQLDP